MISTLEHLSLPCLWPMRSLCKKPWLFIRFENVGTQILISIHSMAWLLKSKISVHNSWLHFWTNVNSAKLVVQWHSLIGYISVFVEDNVQNNWPQVSTYFNHAPSSKSYSFMLCLEPMCHGVTKFSQGSEGGVVSWKNCGFGFHPRVKVLLFAMP